MYSHFNIQQFYVLPSQCIYVDLRTNSDYFPVEYFSWLDKRETMEGKS